MQTTVRMRITGNMKDALQALAQSRKTSVSKEVRDALSAYIDGRRHLVADPGQTHKDTTFVCDAEDLVAFKSLVKESGLSFDEAIRIALTEHIDEKSSHNLHTE